MRAESRHRRRRARRGAVPAADGRTPLSADLRGGHAGIPPSASESTVIRFLGLVSTRLGRALAASKEGWRVETNANGSFVTLTYATTFDRGRGNEEFVFRIDGEAARLAGYHINSLDLMMDQLDPNGNAATPASNGADAATEIRAMSNESEPAPVRR